MTTPGDTYHDWKVKLVAEGRAFDVPAWWARLRTVTFPAVFLPLPLPAAQACIAQYQHSFCSRAPPGPEHVAALRGLCDAIEAGLREARAGDGRAASAPSATGAPVTASVESLETDRFFVRLSSRSPKDAGAVSRDAHAARVRLHMARLVAHDRSGDGGVGASVVHT